MLLTLVPEERARHVDLLSADNDDLLSVEQLLGKDGGQTTQQVTTTIDDDDLLEHDGKRMEGGGKEERVMEKVRS